VVTRLDRLARSTRDLLNVLDAVTERDAGFRSLKDTWADTTTSGQPDAGTAPGKEDFERPGFFPSRSDRGVSSSFA
jgi:hypothetical protein